MLGRNAKDGQREAARCGGAAHVSAGMRIGFLSQPGHTVLPPAGSLEIWTHEVGRRLAERGHEVTIYATRVRGGRDEQRDGIAYRFIEHGFDSRIARVARPAYRVLPHDRPFFSSRLHPLLYWLRAADTIASDGCEVVHVYNYSQALPFVRRANPDAILALHMQCEWLTQLAPRMIERRLQDADLVLGCSNYITEKIARRFPLLDERLATLYNGAGASGAPAPARNGTPRAGLRLLHVGRISPEKGLHVLFPIFNELAEQHPDLTLTLVGEESPIPMAMAVDLFGEDYAEELRPFYRGSYLDHLRASLSERARERVRFAGRVSHEEASAFYREADIFVFPSIFEAFPLPPIEAMAAGLPVVATAVGGTVESVRDGETGFLVERGDQDGLARALEKLIADETLRADFGAAGRLRASELFSWDTVCDAFEAQLASARPQRR
jgi:glycosyltransferase involved in cell wall biosynthesis